MVTSVADAGIGVNHHGVYSLIKNGAEKNVCVSLLRKARENLMNLSEAYLCPVNCSFNFTIGLKFFKIKKKWGKYS